MNRHPEWPHISEEVVDAYMELSGFRVDKKYRLKNSYWPTPGEQEIEEAFNSDDPNARTRFYEHWGFYLIMQQRGHGWLCVTQYGPIVIKPRKKVIVIEWDRTGLSVELTDDDDRDVTKTKTMIHAWTTEKVLDYLGQLHEKLKERKEAQERDAAEVN